MKRSPPVAGGVGSKLSADRMAGRWEEMGRKAGCEGRSKAAGKNAGDWPGGEPRFLQKAYRKNAAALPLCIDAGRQVAVNSRRTGCAGMVFQPAGAHL